MDALRSGAIADNEVTYVETSVEGPGTLTFWWKVSSEQSYDFLRFTMNGAEVAAAPAISGEVGWQQKTVSVPAFRRLRWTYSKDVDTSTGWDAGWVDNVVFTPTKPKIVVNDDFSGVGFARGSVVGWGDNTYGQAVAPPGLGRVIAVSSGGEYTVALRRDGRVEAWGAGGPGQTGYPHYEPVSVSWTGLAMRDRTEIA